MDGGFGRLRACVCWALRFAIATIQVRTLGHVELPIEILNEISILSA